MLALALFGVAYTSFSQAPVRGYWLALGPFIGLTCVIAGWRAAGSREKRFELVWTQTMHWCAVLLTMELMLVADVAHMMNGDAKALSARTALALGTFTAGLHGAWRVCFVGVVFGLGVPGIAWLEQSALLILLIIVAVAAIIVPLIWMMHVHKEWLE